MLLLQEKFCLCAVSPSAFWISNCSDAAVFVSDNVALSEFLWKQPERIHSER